MIQITKKQTKQNPSKAENKKILITSALPYVNNVPHLGNIIGCVLSADVFARYCRSSGKETLYICGTDEYGTATEIKALEEGVTPLEICDKYHKIHKEIYEWFGIAFDYFGRTSRPVHTKITQDIFLKLHGNGHVVEEEVEQPYDEKAKLFLADRYIEGTCPFCKSEQARADQCDKCGKLLTFAELINPISRVSKTKPLLRKTKHLFIDLPGIEEKLSVWIEKSAKEGKWSSNTYNIAKAWLKEGLKKRAITRDLKWGIPVPLAGWEGKVLYVWFDAPIGYISITADYFKEDEVKWKDQWQNPENTLLYQFMGKDNVPFHTVIFPSTLIGTKEHWTLVHHLSTTEFLNYEGGKFSKSRGIGVFGNDAIESGVPADVWRYYLLVNRPEAADTNFTWKDFGEKLNNELVANIGNLVNRTLVFAQNNFDSVIPESKATDLADADTVFIAEQKQKISMITELLENVKLKDALHHTLALSSSANKYFQDNAPWKLVKEGDDSKKRCGTVISVLLHQVKDLAILLEPYLPQTSAAMFQQLGSSPRKWDDLGKLSLAGGTKLGIPAILFKKIEQKEVEALQQKYAGKQGEAKLPDITFSDFDIEVGEITDVQKHPNAEKLYIEKVQLADGVRQLVSGLAKYYLPEQLLHKRVLVVRNLKPAVLRGVKSEGMLLAAENKEGLVEVVSPKKSKVGEKVLLVGGAVQKPKSEIDIDDFFKVKIIVENQKVVVAEGKENKQLATKSEPIHTENVIEGKVS
ncbi:MAG: methionine--tRNA ligase [Candidatus Micrarchaeota archaeon]